MAKGAQVLSGFAYSAASVTFGSAAPAVTAPGGAQGALSYAATPADVCTVEASTGALTLAGVGSCEVTVTAAGTADYEEASATFSVEVQAAGSLVLNVAAIATDDVVNIAEKASGFEISGDTGTEAGVSVTVTIGGTPLSATSADANGTATWSVPVPADAAYITGTSVAVAVTVTASKTGYTAPDDVTRTLDRRPGGAGGDGVRGAAVRCRSGWRWRSMTPVTGDGGHRLATARRVCRRGWSSTRRAG